MKPNRPEKPERLNKPKKPDRPNKPDKPDKPERPDYSSGPDPCGLGTTFSSVISAQAEILMPIHSEKGPEKRSCSSGAGVDSALIKNN